MQKWLQAFRLQTLPLAFSCIFSGGALAIYFNSSNNFNLVVFLLCLLTTLFLQILSNLANDYGDALKGVDNEARIGPVRAIQSGAISTSSMQKALYVFVGLSLFSGVPLVIIATQQIAPIYLISFLVLGIAAIWAAIKYTAGDNPYGYKALGDVFVFVFFGVVGVVGSYFLLTNTFDWYILFPAITIGLWSAAVLNLNNMRDRENDGNNRKITLAVKLGFLKAKYYHYIIVLGGIFCSGIFTFLTAQHWLHFLPFLIFPILLKHLFEVKHITDVKSFNPELKKVALATFGWSLLLFFSILW